MDLNAAKAGTHRRVMGPSRAVFLVMLAVLCSHFIACTKPEQRRYEFKGKVVSVDKRGKTVTIAHEAIPDYMDAMTMAFKLKDERSFDTLQAGDRVQATLVIQGYRSWLEDLVIVRETADPSSAANPAAWVEPKPGDEVPDFQLVNQDGKRILLHQYRGRALLVTFIYTRCPLPDYCPLMTSNFAEINEAIQKDPARYPETHLLSISVDPEYDTPKILKSYGATHAGDAGRATFERWEFASGTAGDVKKIAGYFGLQYFPDKDQIVHSLRTALIGPDGKLVKIYRGNEWKPSEVLGDILSLRSAEQ